MLETEDQTRGYPRWRTALTGAVLCVILGFVATSIPALRHLSYDIPFRWKPALRAPEEVVIVEMTTTSQASLHPGEPDPWNPARWSRATHARFLRHAWALGAEMVVFDVNFISSRPDDDMEFAEAMKVRPGKVVIGARLGEAKGEGVVMSTPVTPTALLEDAAGVGMVNFFPDSDGVRRQLYFNPYLPEYPSLAMEAAQVFGRAPAVASELRWLNYYGGRGALNSIGYDRFMDQPTDATNLYAGKTLFVGRVSVHPEEFDLHPTPYTGRAGELTPGVELHATAFLNLIHHQWLGTLPVGFHYLLLIGLGGVLGGGFTWLRPIWSVPGGVVLFFLVLLGACFLSWSANFWFPWLAIGAVQLPCAVVWSFVANTQQLARKATNLESELGRLTESGAQAASAEPETDDAPTRITTTGSQRLPEIPDHTLLRCFGRGAYGEVWLARDIVGSYHAVKVMYRNTFLGEEPFQREFHGIEKYTPISRTHPGWVDILHVGRNEAGGYYFYIMELGDDETSGQDFAPDDYKPRTLADELKAKKRLPLEEGLALGLDLAEALRHLHEHGLIHRDIKPSNVIYVRGAPKFADIGLVTNVNTEGAVSHIGTEGYMAPEGPGTPSADVYSLGKLLYEVFTGRDRRAFPEMHTGLFENPALNGWPQIQVILQKACADSPDQRYSDAAVLRADLVRLMKEL